MAHAIQQSSDTEQHFVGVFIHDATIDIHQDIFGGANWDNDVWVGVAGPNPGPPRMPAALALNVKKFAHRSAPHGEALGPDLGPKNASVLAPPAAQGVAALLGGLFVAKDHGDHRDAMLGLVLAIASGDLIRAGGAIVLAAHYDTARQFLYVTETAGDAETVAGAAAMVMDPETGAGQLALCLFGARRGDLKRLSIRSGAEVLDLPDPQGAMDEIKGVGMAGLLEFSLETGAGDMGAGFGIAARFRKGVQWDSAFVPGETLEIAEVAAGGCRPASAKATKWGPWNTQESEADKAAFRLARETAEFACHGSCGGGTSCKYTEESSELLETETRVQGSQTEYRSKVKSEGKCECQ